MVIHWYGGTLDRKVIRETNRRLKNVGRYYAGKLRRNIGIQGPPRSKPGEYPRKDTQKLWRSIKQDQGNGWVEVSTNVPYSQDIEHKRPHMRRTLRVEWLRMADVFHGSRKG